MKQRYIDRIVDACPVQFFLSANDGCRVHWPFRMQPVHEATDTYCGDAEKYIVDSSWNDKTITNEDTLDKAAELGADLAVLEDVYQNYEETVKKLRTGYELYESHEFDGDVVAPLQAPHTDCWDAIGQPDIIAIGGVKNEPAAEKIRVARDIRRYVGDDVWIHGLGFGATPELVLEIRENPTLLDSIDAQTPFASENTKDMWPGQERMSPVALRSLANLIEKCRRMTPEFTDNPNPVQQSLGDANNRA